MQVQEESIRMFEVEQKEVRSVKKTEEDEQAHLDKYNKQNNLSKEREDKERLFFKTKQ